jgi:hypothetical protein
MKQIQWRRDSGATVWHNLSSDSTPDGPTVAAWNAAIGWQKYRVVERPYSPDEVTVFGSVPR